MAIEAIAAITRSNAEAQAANVAALDRLAHAQEDLTGSVRAMAETTETSIQKVIEVGQEQTRQITARLDEQATVSLRREKAAAEREEQTAQALMAFAESRRGLVLRCLDWIAANPKPFGLVIVGVTVIATAAWLILRDADPDTVRAFGGAGSEAPASAPAPGHAHETNDHGAALPSPGEN